MRAMSSKRRRENRLRRKMADALGPTRCALQTDRCTGMADDWHELVSPRHGGSRVDPRNIAPACRACNRRVEGHPARFDRGWKVRSWAAVPGDGGWVPAEPSPYALASMEDAA